MFDEQMTAPAPIVRVLESWLKTVENEWQTHELSELIRETRDLIEKLKSER